MSRTALALGLMIVSMTLLGAPCRPTQSFMGAGFRWSPYGPPPGQDPGPAYWADVAHEMARRFSGTLPRGIWIPCEVDFETTGALCDFDAVADDPLIGFTGNPSDPTESALQLFDQLGVQVWLQVEPVFASVSELIEILLSRYGHHPSVRGVGVDVEWYRNASGAAFGEPVSDAEANAWVGIARSFVPQSKVFLKHWLIGHMPPTARAFLVFVDDSQGHASLQAMVGEFEAWAQAFGAWRVAFQIGYESDRVWWDAFADPPQAIGDALRAAIPRLSGLYWVDFTALDVFPPP